MNILSIIVLAFGLSMDAFAVSVASGIIIKKNRHAHALRFSLSFGFFQMLMPILGWLAGVGLKKHIEHIDHWIAFGLLLGIGMKMIYEAFQIETLERTEHYFSNTVILMLSIATSIDALAVGLSLTVLDVAIIFPAAVIGLVTFAVSYCGFLLGNRFGHVLEQKIQIAGGILLISIGIRILLEHLGYVG